MDFRLDNLRRHIFLHMSSLNKLQHCMIKIWEQVETVDRPNAVKARTLTPARSVTEGCKAAPWRDHVKEQVFVSTVCEFHEYFA